jgi:PAS domain S-box-containing protein
LELLIGSLSPDFMPHGYCYLWDPLVLWLHVISDSLITLSYYCIPIILIYFIRKNRDIPFNRVFWMFGTFILACGTTHLLEIWNIWHSAYLLSGFVKAITAGVSVITAAMLIPLVPKVVTLPDRIELAERNRRLEEEIAYRKQFDTHGDAPFRRKVTGGFIVAVLLTIFLGLASWWGARRAEQDAYSVSHTHEVMETIQRTTRHVIEAETSARAFALTGEESLLLHFQAGRDDIGRDESTLRQLTADNPIQQQRIDLLHSQVAAALEFADLIIARRQKQGAYPAARDALEIEKHISVVRGTTREMYEEEDQLLTQRAPRIRAGQQLSRLIATLGIFFGVGLWVLAKLVVNREIDISSRAQAQINALNAELEQRVAQRTADLQSEITERKRAEASGADVLKELADQKFALDQHAIVATTDVQGTITYVNDKFCTISKYSKEELIGQNHRILNSGHHPKEFFQKMYHTIANGQVWRGEICNRAKDGSIYWVDTTVVPLLDAKGKPRQYLAIRADISERKRAEEASQNVLKELADQKFALDQHAIVATTDVQGTITYVNDKFCSISKYSKDELIGQNHRILNSGHHPKEFFQKMYYAIANGQVWRGEICNRAKDGSIYWVATTIVPLLDAKGKPRQYMAIRADITERKRSEAVRERLAAVVESSDDAIISKDLNGTINAWNRGAEKIFGYTAAEAVGQPMVMLFPPELTKEEPGILARVRSGQSVEHYETVRLRKGGAKIYVSVTISPVRDGNGTVVGASKIARDITDRKRAEKALREGEERFQAMADGIPQLAWMAEPDGHIFWYNRRWYEYTGTTFQQMEGWGWQSVHDPAFLPKVLEGWKDAIAHGKPFEMEFPLRGADGNFRTFLTRIVPVRDPEGHVARWFGTNTDITDRKQVEEVLREQAQVLDLAQVLVRDIQGRIVLWNQGAEKLYGFTREEAVGRKSHELLQTQFPEPLEQIEDKLKRTGSWEGELVHRRRDRTSIVVSSLWVLHRDAQGNPLRVLEANVDITARKRAEHQLAGQAEELSRQAEELLRSQQALETQKLMLQSVLNSMVEGLVAADEQGKFIIWNPAAEKIIGLGAVNLSTEEWTGHYGFYLADTVTPFPTEQYPLLRAIRGEATTTEMFVRNREVAEGAWIEASGSPLKSKDGTIRGGVVAFRDITQRKKDEQKIRALNEDLEERVIVRTAQLEAANKELEAFTYSVSHDLRAPLRHINGFTRILMEDFGPTLPAEAQQNLKRIEQGAERMGRLVDELLNLTRVGRQALAVQVTGLASIVTEVRTVLEPEIEGRKIEWKIGDLPFVECDPGLVRQVFQNLVGNALKYSRPRSPAVIEIGQIVKDASNAIFVRDNGVGFSMKYADKLFGVFQRLHRPEDFEGTGVGLATVHRIIQKHGGRIWAEAELDRGATFYFTLGGSQQSPVNNAVLNSATVAVGGKS